MNERAEGPRGPSNAEDAGWPSAAADGSRPRAGEPVGAVGPTAAGRIDGRDPGADPIGLWSGSDGRVPTDVDPAAESGATAGTDPIDSPQRQNEPGGLIADRGAGAV